MFYYNRSRVSTAHAKLNYKQDSSVANNDVFFFCFEGGGSRIRSGDMSYGICGIYWWQHNPWAVYAVDLFILRIIS